MGHHQCYKAACFILTLVGVLGATALAADRPPAAQEPLVTLALDRAPLTKVAAELTRQTGIQHLSTKEGDRQLVVVYCTAQPVSTVRAAITNLLGWSWSRHTAPDGEVRYTLVKSVALRKQEEALRARFWDEYRGILRSMVAAAQDPNHKAKDGSALDFEVRGASSGGILRALGVLPQETVASIMAGKPYVGRWASLPGEFKKVVAQANGAFTASDGSSTPINGGDTLHFEVTVDAKGRPTSLQLSVWRGGTLRLQFNTAHTQLALLDAQNNDRQRAAEWIPQQAREHPELRSSLAKQPALTWPKPPEPAPSRIGWELRDLSRRITTPIIADCYPAAEVERAAELHADPPPWPAPSNDGHTLLRTLEALREAQNYDWRYHDKWLVFRYTQWFWEPVRPVAVTGPPQNGAPKAP